MTVSTRIVRGNYVEFTASFLGSRGTPVEPDAATLYVSYIANGAMAEDTIAMAPTDDDPLVWFGVWKSNGVDPNLVSWSVLGQSGALTMAEDGKLEVSANNANPVGVHS